MIYLPMSQDSRPAWPLVLSHKAKIMFIVILLSERATKMVMIENQHLPIVMLLWQSSGGYSRGRLFSFHSKDKAGEVSVDSFWCLL